MALVDRLRAYSGRVAGLDRLPREPARKWAILSCMDARIHLEEIGALVAGDAHMLRNAGAVVTDDVIRSLVISSQILGVREFAVIAHTGCGLLALDEPGALGMIRERTHADVSALRLGAFSDLQGHVRRQVAALASSPLLPAGCPVTGWVYDLASGRVDEVAGATTGRS